MVITVLDDSNLIKFINMMKQYPDTFFYFSEKAKVHGDFHYGHKI